ncbi:hypothetical protein SGPA1_40713 [Streptomyces misionensis JCM 4497]
MPDDLCVLTVLGIGPHVLEAVPDARVRQDHGRRDILVNNAALVAAPAPGGFWERPLSAADLLTVGLRSHYTAAWQLPGPGDPFGPRGGDLRGAPHGGRGGRGRRNRRHRRAVWRGAGRGRRPGGPAGEDSRGGRRQLRTGAPGRHDRRTGQRRHRKRLDCTASGTARDQGLQHNHRRPPRLPQPAGRRPGPPRAPRRRRRPGSHRPRPRPRRRGRLRPRGRRHPRGLLAPAARHPGLHGRPGRSRRPRGPGNGHPGTHSRVAGANRPHSDRTYFVSSSTSRNFDDRACREARTASTAHRQAC